MLQPGGMGNVFFVLRKPRQSGAGRPLASRVQRGNTVAYDTYLTLRFTITDGLTAAMRSRGQNSQ